MAETHSQPVSRILALPGSVCWKDIHWLAIRTLVQPLDSKGDVRGGDTALRVLSRMLRRALWLTALASQHEDLCAELSHLHKKQARLAVCAHKSQC